MRLVYETHSVSEDNERGIATRWAFEHLLNGRALEELIRVEFVWQEGWEYRISSPYTDSHLSTA